MSVKVKGAALVGSPAFLTAVEADEVTAAVSDGEDIHIQVLFIVMESKDAVVVPALLEPFHGHTHHAHELLVHEALKELALHIVSRFVVIHCGRVEIDYPVIHIADDDRSLLRIDDPLKKIS